MYKFFIVYDFVICGFIVIIKLVEKLFISEFIWIDILCVVLIIVLKNRFKRILDNWFLKENFKFLIKF